MNWLVDKLSELYVNLFSKLRKQNVSTARIVSMKEEMVSYIKRHPRIVAGVVATTLGVSVLVGNPPSKKEQKEEKQVELAKEQALSIVSIKENQLSTEEKELLNDGNVILKVEPTGYTYAEIYDTIDFVKQLVSENKIDYPILYDIEPLMGASTLRANCLLAEEFCNKLSANGIYAALYGSEEAMKRFDEAFREKIGSHSIDLYDKCIVYEGEEVTYQGVHHMQQKKDGEIVFQYDLKKVIEDNGLNRSEKFVPDQTYVIEAGENLISIASKVQMKVSDLAKYNKIEDQNQILVGQELVIPNAYQNEQLKEEGNESQTQLTQEEQDMSETRNHLLKGIDVSEYQGPIDWPTVKENIDYAILRLCDFYYKQEDGTCKLDKQFYENITACEKLDIPVGVYYFSRSTNQEEAVEEAKFVSACLKAYSLEYPVYMDIETEYQNKLIGESPEKMEEIVIAAMTELEGDGYYAGVYCNRGADTDTNRRGFIHNMSNQYSFWLTSNPTYNIAVDFEEFKEEGYNVLLIPDNKIEMYQYSERGTIEGINDQQVDINYANQQLTEVIVEKGFSKVKE